MEAGRTAPRHAPWAVGNVKRRETERRERTGPKRLRRAQARGEAQQPRGVKRAAGLETEPLMGGFLGRELQGRDILAGQTGVTAWVRGLRKKGSVRLWPEVSEEACTVSGMWDGGHGGGGGDTAGLGLVYGGESDTGLC